MSDIIRLLPEAIANQIAAGEVIQRPASALKEMLENAIDAGASEVKIVLVESGRTLIQISDNGKGMSPMDARMCFERHATSKIKSADDLFNLNTFGFRGEAMASIASVAQVELKTKRESDQVGTKFIIEGSEIKDQEACTMLPGTIISVKSLFFNVPARRNFLKSDSIELKHCIEEFMHVALSNPEVAMSITNNNQELYRLREQSFGKRIISLFGDKIEGNLISLSEMTNIVEIEGFVSKPNWAKRARGEQYLFVNNRFVKDAYMHHAIMSAYEGMLPEKHFPSYFLNFQLDPKTIDVNVHPSKTEINFENGQFIYSILQSAVKRAVTRVDNTLDFEQDEMMNNIPMTNQAIKIPSINFNPDYNPFKSSQSEYKSGQTGNWREIYSPPNFLQTDDEENNEPEKFFVPEEVKEKEPYQLHNTYIFSPIKSGLLIIKQEPAHERILYEQYREMMDHKGFHSQKLLFPETHELNVRDYGIVQELLPDLADLGFEIDVFGNNSFVMHSSPSEVEKINFPEFMDELVQQFTLKGQSDIFSKRDKLAQTLAKSAKIKSGRALDKQEMKLIIDMLFACDEPSVSPSGVQTMIMMSLADIEQKFK